VEDGPAQQFSPTRDIAQNLSRDISSPSEISPASNVSKNTSIRVKSLVAENFDIDAQADEGPDYDSEIVL
jgi:hypothetical protein